MNQKHFVHLNTFWRIPVCLLLFLISCNRDLATEGCFDLSTNTNTSLFDVFDEIDAIQLETNDDSYLRSAGAVRVFESKFFVCDFHRVLCFSDEGKFLFQVSRQGRGQGEYHNLTDIAIDKHNSRLVLLDALFQKVHFFDLDGTFQKTAQIESEAPLGLNRVIPMGESLLLFIGLNQMDFILYCLDENAILERFGGVLFCPPFFLPRNNAYLFENNAFVLPSFENTVYKATEKGFVPHKEWCFGEDDNTTAQIDKLKSNFNEWLVSGRDLPPNAIVGRRKYLNHYLRFVRENDRFILAQIEHNNDYKNIVIDKKTGTKSIFNHFNEGTQLFLQGVVNDSILVYPGGDDERIERHYRQIIPGVDERDKPYFEDYFLNRNRTYYTRDMLTERGKQVYDNHDPLHDNPYLVIFKFKQ